MDTLGTWCSVLYTVEPLCCGHLGDLVKCPVYSGAPLLWTPWGPGEEGFHCIVHVCMYISLYMYRLHTSSASYNVNEYLFDWDGSLAMCGSE